MKRFKGFFLFLVIMLLSLGIGSTIYARDRDDDQRFDRYEREEQRNERGFGGPKLGYDGRTSGIGRELGGFMGSKLGGHSAGLAGDYFGGKIGGRAGDAWERRTNRYAHDRWNSRGSRGHSWRF